MPEFTPDIEWMDIPLGGPVGITLPAAAWAMIMETISMMEIKSPAMVKLSNAIYAVLVNDLERLLRDTPDA